MQSSRLETVPCVCGPGGEGDAEAINPFFLCASLIATRRRMPSQPSKVRLCVEHILVDPAVLDKIHASRCDVINNERATYLAKSFKSARGDFHSHHLAEGSRVETFALDVGVPRATCLVFRERNIVAILFCLSVEQAELRPTVDLCVSARPDRSGRQASRSQATTIQFYT